jgi:hypothetical protein
MAGASSMSLDIGQTHTQSKFYASFLDEDMLPLISGFINILCQEATNTNYFTLIFW